MTWAATISPPTPSQLGQAKRKEAGLDPVSGSPWHPLEGPLDAQQLPGFSESTPAASRPVLSFTLASDVSLFTPLPPPHPGPWRPCLQFPRLQPFSREIPFSCLLCSLPTTSPASPSRVLHPCRLSDYPRLWRNAGSGAPLLPTPPPSP